MSTSKIPWTPAAELMKMSGASDLAESVVRLGFSPSRPLSVRIESDEWSRTGPDSYSCTVRLFIDDQPAICSEFRAMVPHPHHQSVARALGEYLENNSLLRANGIRTATVAGWADGTLLIRTFPRSLIDVLTATHDSPTAQKLAVDAIAYVTVLYQLNFHPKPEIVRSFRSDGESVMVVALNGDLGFRVNSRGMDDRDSRDLLNEIMPHITCPIADSAVLIRLANLEAEKLAQA